MLEFDDFAKWIAFYRKLPFWVRICVIILIIASISIWTYSYFGTIREIKSQNLLVTEDLKQAKPHCFINSIRFKTVIRINKGTNVQKRYIAELHKK